MRDLERILYFEAFVVVDPGEVPEIKERELLTEERYRELVRHEASVAPIRAALAFGRAYAEAA